MRWANKPDSLAGHSTEISTRTGDRGFTETLCSPFPNSSGVCCISMLWLQESGKPDLCSTRAVEAVLFLSFVPPSNSDKFVGIACALTFGFFPCILRRTGALDLGAHQVKFDRPASADPTSPLRAEAQTYGLAAAPHAQTLQASSTTHNQSSRVWDQVGFTRLFGLTCIEFKPL